MTITETEGLAVMNTLIRACKVIIPNMLAVLAMGLMLISTQASAQEYKKITRLGTSQAVCPGGVQTVADLQEFFRTNPNAIRSILADSGWSGDANALFEAVANGDLTERAYPVGTKMAWMGF